MNIHPPFMKRGTSWGKVSIFFFLFILLQVLINGRIIGVGRLLELSGGHNILDFDFYNGPAETLAKLGDMGPEARYFYKTKIIPLDFLFPLGYGLFLSHLLCLIYERFFTKTPIFGSYKWIPLVGTVMDYMENICNFTLLQNFPHPDPFFLHFSGIFSAMKFCFIYASYFLVVAGLLSFLISWIFRRVNENDVTTFKGIGNLLAPIGYGISILLIAGSFINRALFTYSIATSIRVILGTTLLGGGLIVHLLAAFPMLRAFREARLVENGMYCICRNPMYFSMIFIILPGVSLLTNTTSLLIVSPILTAVVFSLIPKEEMYLLKKFGDHYQKYSQRRALLVPLIL